MARSIKITRIKLKTLLAGIESSLAFTKQGYHAGRDDFVKDSKNALSRFDYLVLTCKQ